MPAAQFVIFLAVVGQVLLTFMVAFRMAFLRLGAIKRGEADIKRAALEKDIYPAPAIAAANCYSNQFELPVLFYAAAAFALIVGAGDWLSALLAVLFLIARLIHAMIFVGRNEVRQRFYAFGAGLLILLIWWGYLLGRALGGYLALA